LFPIDRGIVRDRQNAQVQQRVAGSEYGGGAGVWVGAPQMDDITVLTVARTAA
jgi:hypothetical protein